jgi:serine/threonine-protein phosphatase 2A regulatory subunit B''
MDEISSSLSSMQINLRDFPSAKIKVDEYFREWLSLESTTNFVEMAVTEVSSANLESEQSSHGGDNPTFPSHQPPRSPSKKSPKKRTLDDSASAVDSAGGGTLAPRVLSSRPALASVPQAEMNGGSASASSFDSIPVFYRPGMSPRGQQVVLVGDSLKNRLEEIEAFFHNHPHGVPVDKFVFATKRLCGLPSFFNLPLCRRLNAFYTEDGSPRGAVNRVNDREIRVKLRAFVRYWREEIEPFSPVERFFRVIKQPTSEYITKDDFTPFIQELLVRMNPITNNFLCI